MNERLGCGLACLLTAFALGASSAAGATDQTLIVTPPDCCAGGAFTVQTLNGTVVDSVPVPDGAEPMAFASAADGSIVYDDASQGDGGDEGAVWLVASGRAPVELDSSSHDYDASISFDGSKVTFARLDPTTGASDIYVVNADGSGLALVAPGQGDNRLTSPKFSPDGHSIAYTCNPATPGLGRSLGCGPLPDGQYRNSGVMLMNADGTDRRMILSLAVYSFAWSPDGEWLSLNGCVTTHVNDLWSCGPRQIFAYRTDGSDLFNDFDTSHQVTHATEDEGLTDAQFSPDGSQLLFMKIVDNSWVLYAVNRDGTNEHAVAPVPNGRFELVPPATGGGPSSTVDVNQWKGPGIGPIVIRSSISQCSGLIFETADGAFGRCVSSGAGTEPIQYSAAADGSVVFSDASHGFGGSDGGPVWLGRSEHAPVEVDSSPYDENPSITWNGSKVTFDRVDPTTGSSDIYVGNADGSDLKLVASGGGTDTLQSPEFSPDGGSIAYLSRGAIMLMKADGSDKRMVVAGRSEFLSWSPDGQWLATVNCVPIVTPEGQTCVNQIFAYHTDGSDLFDQFDPKRQITHEKDLWGPSFSQFSPDGSRLFYLRAVDDSGSQGNFTYTINRDGTGEHEVSLTDDRSFQGFGELVPALTGGAPLSRAPTQAIVPQVRTLSYHVAKRRLAAVHLRAKITHRSYSARIRRGHVIAQFPRARTRARLTRKHRPVVRLVLSRGRRPHKARH